VFEVVNLRAVATERKVCEHSVTLLPHFAAAGLNYRLAISGKVFARVSSDMCKTSVGTPLRGNGSRTMFSLFCLQYSDAMYKQDYYPNKNISCSFKNT
jgi:hypothetical protein